MADFKLTYRYPTTGIDFDKQFLKVKTEKGMNQSEYTRYAVEEQFKRDFLPKDLEYRNDGYFYIIALTSNETKHNQKYVLKLGQTFNYKARCTPEGYPPNDGWQGYPEQLFILRFNAPDHITYEKQVLKAAQEMGLEFIKEPAKKGRMPEYFKMPDENELKNLIQIASEISEDYDNVIKVISI